MYNDLKWLWDFDDFENVVIETMLILPNFSKLSLLSFSQSLRNEIATWYKVFAIFFWSDAHWVRNLSGESFLHVEQNVYKKFIFRRMCFTIYSYTIAREGNVLLSYLRGINLYLRTTITLVFRILSFKTSAKSHTTRLTLNQGA